MALAPLTDARRVRLERGRVRGRGRPKASKDAGELGSEEAHGSEMQMIAMFEFRRKEARLTQTRTRHGHTRN